MLEELPCEVEPEVQAVGVAARGKLSERDALRVGERQLEHMAAGALLDAEGVLGIPGGETGIGRSVSATLRRTGDLKVEHPRGDLDPAVASDSAPNSTRSDSVKQLVLARSAAHCCDNRRTRRVREVA